MSEEIGRPSAAAIVVHRGVTVRIYPLPDRRKSAWLLAYYTGSRRRKQTCKGTLEDARKRAREVAVGIGTGDVIDALHMTPLDRRVYVTSKEAAAVVGRPVDEICREAAAAHRIAPGVSHRELAEFYARHHRSDLPSAQPAQVVDELLAHLVGKRRSSVTLKSLRVLLRPFARDFAMPIAQIQHADLDRWLTAQARLSPRSIRNLRGALVQLFNFARDRYLPKKEPTAASDLVMPSNDNRGAVEIFRPWEMETLLAHCPSDLRPVLALGAFAGLRTIELCRLEWSAVRLPDPESPVDPQFPHGFIVIDKAVAKQHRTAARRIIPIQPNLAAWLEPHRFAAGPVSPTRCDWKLSAAITAAIAAINAGLRKSHRREIGRPKNGLRHSFGSYRLPAIGNVAQLALEMNNSPREIIENYRELVMPKDVEAWWKIAPIEPAQVIQLELLG